MYADRYAKPTLKPASLGVALAINGAVIAALIFSAPQVFQPPEDGLTIRNIPLPPPPPEPTPEPEVRPREANPNPAPPQPVPYEKPVVETDRTGPTFDLDPGFNPGPEVGSGVTIRPEPVPVLVGPRLDTRYAAGFQPTYPAEERRAGNAGRVVVRVLVGVDGRVKQVERVSAPSDAFFEATKRRAFDKWRFTPATRDGTPVEQWFTVGVSFVLND